MAYNYELTVTRSHPDASPTTRLNFYSTLTVGLQALHHNFFSDLSANFEAEFS